MPAHWAYQRLCREVSASGWRPYMRLRSRLIFIALIDDLGISERELARRAGLSHSTVNHLISSRRLSCALPTALAITRALDCPIGTLFIPESASEEEAIAGLNN
jgi:DNA-binding Xre family transcriptional regulator